MPLFWFVSASLLLTLGFSVHFTDTLVVSPGKRDAISSLEEFSPDSVTEVSTQSLKSVSKDQADSVTINMEEALRSLADRRAKTPGASFTFSATRVVDECAGVVVTLRIIETKNNKDYWCFKPDVFGDIAHMYHGRSSSLVVEALKHMKQIVIRNAPQGPNDPKCRISNKREFHSVMAAVLIEKEGLRPLGSSLTRFAKAVSTIVQHKDFPQLYTSLCKTKSVALANSVQGSSFFKDMSNHEMVVNTGCPLDDNCMDEDVIAFLRTVFPGKKLSELSSDQISVGFKNGKLPDRFSVF